MDTLTFVSGPSLQFRTQGTFHEHVTRRGKYRCALPSFLPSGASEIEDVSARRMMEALERVPVETKLRSEPIGTVRHYLSGDSEEVGEVVCLHGFDSNLLEYRHLSPILQNGGCTVHSVDMLAWGFTEKPPGISYGVEARREHLASYLRSHCNGPVTVVGASLGGAVALDLALAHPELVNGLILVDAQAYTDRKASMIPRWAARIGAEVLRSAWLRYVAVMLSYRSESYRTRDILRIGGLHVRTEGWLNANIDFILSEGYCLSSRVKELQQRALVVFGRYDKVIPEEDVGKFQLDLPDARVVRIEDAGHSPHIEKAGDVASEIVEFLRATSQVSSEDTVSKVPAT